MQIIISYKKNNCLLKLICPLVLLIIPQACSFNNTISNNSSDFPYSENYTYEDEKCSIHIAPCLNQRLNKKFFGSYIVKLDILPLFIRIKNKTKNTICFQQEDISLFIEKSMILYPEKSSNVSKKIYERTYDQYPVLYKKLNQGVDNILKSPPSTTSPAFNGCFVGLFFFKKIFSKTSVPIRSSSIENTILDISKIEPLSEIEGFIFFVFEKDQLHHKMLEQHVQFFINIKLLNSTYECNFSAMKEVCSFISIDKVNKKNYAQKINSKEMLNYYKFKCRNYALIINIDTYKHWPSFNNFTNETKQLSNILSKKYGYTVHLINNRNATREAILEQLNNYKKLLQSNNSLLVYFSGHTGIDKSGQTYWIPEESKLRNSTMWIPTHEISTRLKKIKSKKILIISNGLFSDSIKKENYNSLINQSPIDLSFNKKTRYVICNNNFLKANHNKEKRNFKKLLIRTFKKVNKSFFTANQFSRELKKANNNIEFKIIRDSAHQGGAYYFFNKKNKN